MNRLMLTALACALAATACSRVREPTDAQLATLLHTDRLAPSDGAATLDGPAVQCLRGWSGDAELLKGLAMTFAGEDGKKTCRTRIDGWIADPVRNPDKFAFADVSDPKSVRRAMALQAARSVASLTNPANRQSPPPMMKAATPMTPIGTPDPNVNLGTAGTQLKEAEDLCVQVQQLAAGRDASAGAKGFANYCGKNLQRLRSSMEKSAQTTPDARSLDAMAVGATNMTTVARKLLATGK